MKECQICGTVSSDKDDVCGVCGTSLAEVQARAENPALTGRPSIEALVSPAKTLRSERRNQGILGLLVGIGMVATGILLVELIALVGILMLLFGFTVIATDISWMRGNTFYDQDEPIIHGKVPFRGLTYGTDVDEEENASNETPTDSQSQLKDEKNK